MSLHSRMMALALMEAVAATAQTPDVQYIILSIADWILSAHKDIRVSRIDLAYTIMEWVDAQPEQKEPQP